MVCLIECPLCLFEMRGSALAINHAATDAQQDGNAPAIRRSGVIFVVKGYVALVA